MSPKFPNTNPPLLGCWSCSCHPFRDIDPLPHVRLIAWTNEVVKASVEHLHGGKQSFVQYMMGHCREKQLRMSPVPSEGVGRVRDGNRGGTERAVVVAAQRGQWQWHVEGGGGSGTETVMGVVWRGQQWQHGDSDRGPRGYREGGRGSTERVTGVVQRWQQWWHREGGGSGTETVTGVVQRGQQQQHRDGNGGGTKTAAAAAWRRRCGWYGDGGGGGMERAVPVPVARRGWADGVGGASLWVGSMLGL